MCIVDFMRYPQSHFNEFGIGIFCLVAGFFLFSFSVNNGFRKWAWIRLKPFFSHPFQLSPHLVLLSGSFLIAWILFNPPLYVIRGGERLLYKEDAGNWMERYYPTPDYITAILHSMGIAVIVGTICYLLKKVVSAQTGKDN